MKTKNFYIFVDHGGKMPVLSPKRFIGKSPRIQKSHPYWIRYVNDKPVQYCGPESVICGNIQKNGVWDYSLQRYVNIAGLTKVQN